MTQVYFIGAGPGDPELITVKGQRLIRQADLVLYAGSLVPREIVDCTKKDARVVDSAPLNLYETHQLMLDAVRKGQMVARVHTGDPSLYGAIREQVRLLDREGIAYEVVPGVTSAFAVAARAGVSFTVPDRTQSLVFTRMAGRTPMPEKERLQAFAKHGTAMAIYLSASEPRNLQEELLEGGYAPDTLVVVGYRIGWPDQQMGYTELCDLAPFVQGMGIKRQAVFLVLPGEDGWDHFSKLYNSTFSHGFRTAKEKE
jgi:precorrin-4/cobalt-precorrin-4 C11-methyltransferase